MRAAAVVVVVAGCVIPATQGGGATDQGPAPATSATIYIQETFILDGRLYTSFEAAGPATARLMRGETPIADLPPSTGCHGVRDPRGLWSDDPRLDPDCSWLVPDLAEGHYAIEVASGGAVLARSDFDIVAVPAAGARTALAVDPAVRSNAPYVRGDRLWAWWPIDARYAWRAIYLHGFAGDTWRGMTWDSIEGPRLNKAGDPAVRVGFAQFDLAETHAIDAIVATAGRHILGAWRPPTSPAVTWTPIPVTDAMARAVAEHIDERVQQTTEDYGVRHRMPMVGRQMVPRVCGAITSETTMKLIEEIEDEDGTHAEGVTSVTSIGGVSYESDAGALISGPRHWDTGLTSYGVMADEDPDYRALIRKLDGKTAAFKKRGDCFARVFAALPYVMPEPDADEPDYRNTCGPTDGCPDQSDTRDPYWKQ